MSSFWKSVLLWGISCFEGKVAVQLHTHLADLLACVIGSPFQAHREDLGHTMDSNPPRGSYLLLTP